MLQRLFRYAQDKPLGRRVLASILLCSTLLAVFATGFQLLLDYRHDISAVQLRMNEIEHSYLESVGASMWSMDDQQTRKQLEGISKLPDISFVQLQDPNHRVLMQVGVRPHSGNDIIRTIPIRFVVNPQTGEVQHLGSLHVVADLSRTYRDIRDRALVILISQTTKALIVAIFTLFIFSRLVSRHLSTLASYTRNLDVHNQHHDLVLARKAPKQHDELDVVVAAINYMAASIRSDFAELQRYRQGLEQIVAERTAELAQRIAEKEAVIEQLNREIIERTLAQRTVHENEARYRQLVDMSPDAILIETNGKIVFVNRGTLRLLGCDNPQQVLGRSVTDLVVQEWREVALEQMQRLLSGNGEERPFEVKVQRFDNTSLDVEVSWALFQYVGMPAVQIVLHDITKHKHYEERLRKQALFDGLTGLPNRTLLMDRLMQALTYAERRSKAVYVLFIDLDHFKYINDTLGHDVGDELLKIVTDRISECLRVCDTLARLGGDEFVLVLGNAIEEHAVMRLVERIVECICEPIMLEHQEVSITCSVGMSVYPDDAHDALTLLKYADMAMYRAKDLGRNGFQRYLADMNTAMSDQVKMEARLRKALERNEFLLFYQPIVDLADGKIIGAEALIRWQHPELGLVPPIRFIPLAEKTGLIMGISNWVLEAVVQQIQSWMQEGLPLIRISINLSAQQLARPGLELDMERVLRRTHIAPESLELEITESMSMTDPERTVQILNKLEGMGLGIAIDDFGTGYSNLAYLKRFPIRRIKLDRSFVKDITHDADDARLARAIIAMAHNLNLTVVAEGVEELAQLELLLAYGCDEIQGYHFSPPIPPDVLAKMLADHRVLELPKLENFVHAT